MVDRVGNVLAIYRMNGARAIVRIGTDRGVVGERVLDDALELAGRIAAAPRGSLARLKAKVTRRAGTVGDGPLDL